MENRYSISPNEAKTFDTEAWRKNFLIDSLFRKGEVALVYSHVDRMITGSAVPMEKALPLEAGKELATENFLDRREMGVINIGGSGKIVIEGQEYSLLPRDGMYIGMGNKNIVFSSDSAENPAEFYILSSPAHQSYPTVKIDISKANALKLGSKEELNQRTIYQFVHPKVCQSCQLCMGMTLLEDGSVWNTMPCHTHERRMEVYLYFDMDDDTLVFHQMGEPQETRHLIMRDREAVISPSWSIHSGVGTKKYTFIWGMAGENQTFDDMDFIKNQDMR